MKYILLLSMLCCVSCKEDQSCDDENKLPEANNLLAPSFPEGFGKALKRQFEIIKPEGSAELFIADPKNESSLIRVDYFTDEVQAELQSLMANKKSEKLTLIGYESIICEGIPGISMSIEDGDELEIPSGPSWHIGSEFVVMRVSRR